MPINSHLFKTAATVVAKQAFVPPGGGDPAAAGGAPPAPGGAPPAPGGAPPGPIDTAAAAGIDPAAMAAASGGAPVAPGGGNPLEQKLDQLITLMSQQHAGGKPGGGKGGGKVDPMQMQVYMQRIQKMMTHMYQAMNIPLPHDILDEPPIDGSQQGGPPGQPGQPAPPAPGGDPAAAGGAAPPNPSGINPIQPVGPVGGAQKQGAVAEQASALLSILAAGKV